MCPNGFPKIISPTIPSTYFSLLQIVNIVNSKLTVLWGGRVPPNASGEPLLLWGKVEGFQGSQWSGDVWNNPPVASACREVDPSSVSKEHSIVQGYLAHKKPPPP